MFIFRRIKWFIWIRWFWFTEHMKGNVPLPGETIRWCGNGDGRLKTVEYVSIVHDTIKYTDGYSDSYRHCGWERLV